MIRLGLFYIFFAFAMTSHAQVGTPQGNLLCSGDSLLLTASSDFAIWNTGLTNDSIYVTESGIYDYQIDGVSAGGVIIEEVPSPTPLTNPEPVTCHGGSDGLVELFSTAGVPLEEVIWNGKQFGTQITNLSAGTYNYVAIDTNGCSASGSVEITEPEAIYVDIEVVGSDLLANASGGTPPYYYIWNNEEGTASFPIQEGSIILEIIDSQACSEQVVYTHVEVNYTYAKQPRIVNGEVHCDPSRRVLIFNRFGQFIGEFGNKDVYGDSELNPFLILVYKR